MGLGARISLEDGATTTGAYVNSNLGVTYVGARNIVQVHDYHITRLDKFSS